MTNDRRSFSSRRHAALFFLYLFVLAFAVRFVFATQWQSTPYGAVPLIDADAYDHWATEIAHGHWLRARAFYQFPLYAYVLGTFYAVAGHNLWGAGILNAVFDSATVCLLAAFSRRAFGLSAAVATGLLATFFAPMIFYVAPVMKEPLTLMLFAGFLYAGLRALQEGRGRDYGLAGIALGLASLSRGNALLLFPVFVFLIYRTAQEKKRRHALLTGAAMALMIAPATLHNFVVARDFVPISYAGGFNLYIGHSAYANGTNAYPPEISSSPAEEEVNTTLIASEKKGKRARPSQVSAYWRHQAVDYALHHPVREAQLLWFKFFAFLNDTDSFDNYDVPFIKQHFPTILNLPLPRFGLIFALAAFALAAGGDKHKRSFIPVAVLAGGYAASVLLFYMLDRYRLPVAVFILPLAGASAPLAFDLARKGKFKKLSAAGLLAMGVYAFSLLPPLHPVYLTAFDWGTLASVYAEENEAEKSIAALNVALALSPQDAGTQAFSRAADMQEKLGQHAQAMAWLRQAVVLYPKNGSALYNLGRQQAAQGDLDGALANFDKAKALSPSYALTYFGAGKIYQHRGDLEAARKIVKEGLAVDPADERLRALAEEVGAF